MADDDLDLGPGKEPSGARKYAVTENDVIWVCRDKLCIVFHAWLGSHC